MTARLLALCLTPRLRGLSAILVITPLICADPQPKFEAASVKRSQRCSMQNSVDPGRISLVGDPLKVVLTEAFKVKMDQIIGPSWLDADCFDVIAKMPEGATKDQLPAMLQALLVERFKLTVHNESRLRSGYALILDKNGVKFKESDPRDPVTRPRTGQVTFGASRETAGIKGVMTMAVLARLLSARLDGPVRDLTGMKGTYDIDVSWAPDRALEKIDRFAESQLTDPSVTNAVASLPPDRGNIFTSIRDSLGLRLEARKQQVEVVVIDSIERAPTEN